jgi:hypothetical protein
MTASETESDSPSAKASLSRLANLTNWRSLKMKWSHSGYESSTNSESRSRLVKKKC